MKLKQLFLPAVAIAMFVSTCTYGSEDSTSMWLSSGSSIYDSSSSSLICPSSTLSSEDSSSDLSCSCSDSSFLSSSSSSCSTSLSSGTSSSSSFTCSDSSTASSDSSSGSSSKSKSSHNEQAPICRTRFNNLRDPLIGTFGIKSICGTNFGVISFNAGGTLHTQDSLDMASENLSHFPEGTLSTVGAGYWEKVKKRKYRFFYTKVVSLKGLNPNPFPTYPEYRIRVEGELTLSFDNKSFKVCSELTRWCLDDLACRTAPFYSGFAKISPGPESRTFEGKRVDFLK